MRVLVVEDEQSLRQAIARRLAARGYSVDKAPDEARADQLLAVRNFKGPWCTLGRGLQATYYRITYGPNSSVLISCSLDL